VSHPVSQTRIDHPARFHVCLLAAWPLVAVRNHAEGIGVISTDAAVKSAGHRSGGVEQALNQNGKGYRLLLISRDISISRGSQTSWDFRRKSICRSRHDRERAVITDGLEFRVAQWTIIIFI